MQVPKTYPLVSSCSDLHGPQGAFFAEYSSTYYYKKIVSKKMCPNK